MAKTVYVIPARGGSKGIPKKNIKELNAKPLIHYAVESARALAADEDIFVSTDSQEILACLKEINYSTDYMRPTDLAQDKSSTYDVLIDAISYWEGQGKSYEQVVLLQPTSPFRTSEHIAEALTLMNDDVEMLVSVEESAHNPLGNCYIENEEGSLRPVFAANDGARQELTKSYRYNGAIYVMSIKALKERSYAQFSKISKYIMSERDSLDLDTLLDWEFAEFLMNR